MFPGEQASGRYDHMALLVHLHGKRYLVDVGNGRAFGQPISISDTEVSESEGNRYKIMAFDADHLGLFCLDQAESESDAQWQCRYAFKSKARTRAYFKDACHYTETSPDSHFTQSKIVSMLTPEGRITLSERLVAQDKTREIFWNDAASEKQKITPEQYQQLLISRFGLHIAV